MDVQELKNRFGLRWVGHRIGEHDLRFAEVREVDLCVEALYPHCLCTHGDAPVWMISWPAAFGLAEYLLNERQPNGRRAMELGCGTAVVGVALGVAGARVTATDYDRLALAVARHNARANGCTLETVRLDWYTPRLEERYPWVVGSEITYHEVAFDPLLRVIERVLEPGGEVILSDIFRPQTDRFLELARARDFEVTALRRVVHLQGASHPLRIIRLQPTGR